VKIKIKRKMILTEVGLGSPQAEKYAIDDKTRRSIMRAASGPEFQHLVLDLVGLIPFVGEPADMINAIKFANEGRYLEGAFSLVSMIPGPSEVAAKAIKYGLFTGGAADLDQNASQMMHANLKSTVRRMMPKIQKVFATLDSEAYFAPRGADMLQALQKWTNEKVSIGENKMKITIGKKILLKEIVGERVKKKKYKKQRNYVALGMIERSQNAGMHTDKKKEKNKNICRASIEENL